MRRIILFVIFFIFLPYCFTRPWIGMLIYSWISYMNPHRFAWIDFPFAEIAAIAVLAGYLATKDKDKFHMERETVIILILWAWFVLTTFTAFNFSVALPMLEKTSKVLLMALMTLPLINTKDKLRYLVLVIALSLGLLGLKGAVFSAITGGVHNIRGPDGSFIA